jgi:hypothetical protein
VSLDLQWSPDFAEFLMGTPGRAAFDERMLPMNTMSALRQDLKFRLWPGTKALSRSALLFAAVLTVPAGVAWIRQGRLELISTQPLAMPAALVSACSGVLAGIAHWGEEAWISRCEASVRSSGGIVVFEGVAHSCREWAKRCQADPYYPRIPRVHTM